MLDKCKYIDDYGDRLNSYIKLCSAVDDFLRCACIFSAGNLILNVMKILPGKKKRHRGKSLGMGMLDKKLEA
jgi:hypothetical protein